MNAAIPRGAKVLSAVEYPALWDFSRFQFSTLDIAGAVSPPPHMPYFQGAAAKVAYLRHLGFDYIVTESPVKTDLYGGWQEFLSSTSYYRKAYASYFGDWQSTVTQLENDGRYGVTHIGHLALIKITSATHSGT